MVAGPPVDLSAWVGGPRTRTALDAATAAVMSDVTKLVGEIRGETPLYAGVLVAPQGIGAMLTMPIAGALTDKIPIGRMIEPEEIASAILFLASDAASAVTGHLLMADGGYTAW